MRGPAAILMERGGEAGLAVLPGDVGPLPMRRRNSVRSSESMSKALEPNTSSGGKNPGAARAKEFFRAGETVFEQALAPSADDLAPGVETSNDLIVGQAFGGKARSSWRGLPRNAETSSWPRGGVTSELRRHEDILVYIDGIGK
jgi:hypothetical protein